MTRTPKPRACKHCASIFVPQRMGQRVCGRMCAQEFARVVNARLAEKKAQEAKRAERAKDNAKRREQMTWRDHHKAASKAVNKLVRTRDEGKPCISCGQPWKPTFQAGHYRSVGSSKHLALDLRNIHGQCVHCNLHQHSNAINYRLGLIARFGVEFVEAIESDNASRHNSPDDLQAIRADALAQVKALKSVAAGRC